MENSIKTAIAVNLSQKATQYHFIPFCDYVIHYAGRSILYD
ncbi:MAG: hypothetical protein QM666_02230 [Acinetobacter sp.]